MIYDVEVVGQLRRGKVGWVVTNVGQGGWDVWLEVSTGGVKLIRHVNA